jgi:hypothetical protein
MKCGDCEYIKPGSWWDDDRGGKETICKLLDMTVHDDEDACKPMRALAECRAELERVKAEVPCPECGGSRRVSLMVFDPAGAQHGSKISNVGFAGGGSIDCPWCKGSGKKYQKGGE